MQTWPAFGRMIQLNLENFLKCKQILLEHGADPLARQVNIDDETPYHFLQLVLCNQSENTLVCRSPSNLLLLTR